MLLVNEGSFRPTDISTTCTNISLIQMSVVLERSERVTQYIYGISNVCAYQSQCNWNLAILLLLLSRSSSNSPWSFQRSRQTLRHNFNWIRLRIKNFPIDPHCKNWPHSAMLSGPSPRFWEGMLNHCPRGRVREGYPLLLGAATKFFVFMCKIGAISGHWMMFRSLNRTHTESYIVIYLCDKPL